MKFRELCIKNGPEALDIIMDIARSGEPDLARFAAAKFIIERGYGPADGENPGPPAVVNVITGVRVSGSGVADLPQHQPRLPDGCPILRQPVVEPPAPCRIEDPAPPAEPEKMDDFTTWPMPEAKQ